MPREYCVGNAGTVFLVCRKKYMKKISKPILALALIIGIFSFSSQAKAASNPSGTGQPKAECGADNALMSPNGFGTSGFDTK